MEVSGTAMSLKWKPRKTAKHNLIAFVDGQGYYSSGYFEIDELSKKKDLLTHVSLRDQEIFLNLSTKGKNMSGLSGIQYSKTKLQKFINFKSFFQTCCTYISLKHFSH